MKRLYIKLVVTLILMFGLIGCGSSKHIEVVKNIQIGDQTLEKYIVGLNVYEEFVRKNPDLANKKVLDDLATLGVSDFTDPRVLPAAHNIEFYKDLFKALNSHKKVSIPDIAWELQDSEDYSREFNKDMKVLIAESDYYLINMPIYIEDEMGIVETYTQYSPVKVKSSKIYRKDLKLTLFYCSFTPAYYISGSSYIGLGLLKWYELLESYKFKSLEDIDKYVEKLSEIDAEYEN